MDYQKYYVPPNRDILDCYNATQGQHCSLYQKNIGKKGCTYSDPTQIDLNSKNYNQNYHIGPKNAPISVHVHGLQVRPTFDGNPLSWMGKDGSVGVGYMSLYGQEQKNTYYNLFQNSTHTKLMSYSKIQQAIKTISKFLPTNWLQPKKTTNQYYYKINKYQNFQPPGNLWYHDHAMHATKANVFLGLAGNYIIHDKNVDSLLPGGKYQIFIIIITQGYLTSNDSINSDSNMKRHRSGSGNPNDGTFGAHVNPENVRFNLSYPKGSEDSAPQFQRNKVYRLRFLNGMFDALFTGLKFVTDCECKDKSRSNCPLNQSICNPVQFAFIGSDSSLFNKPVDKQTEFEISSAQRFQLLIMFNSSIKSDYVHLVSTKSNIFDTGGDENDILIRNTFKLLGAQSAIIPPLINANVTNALKNVPFYDFTNINQQCDSKSIIRNPDPTSCIINNRMRPFFFTQGRFHFNGHYKFSQSGKSQNPQIGTTQDWYLINTMMKPAINHPIHIHLINFQVIDTTTLKYLDGIAQRVDANNKTTPINRCTYYQIDFWKGVKGLIPQNIPGYNYSLLCDYIRKNVDITNQETQNLVNQARRYDQNETDKSDPNRNVSGLDVMLLISKDDKINYQNSNCPNSDYKYVCGPLRPQNVPEYYKRWKQVALVKTGIVMRVRIRWTSVDYNYTIQKYPYFKVPEDQLLQFPGFVYHCHFLQHQDDELMRPIMMQPSGHYLQNKIPRDLKEQLYRSNRTLWSFKYKEINKRMNCSQ